MSNLFTCESRKKYWFLFGLITLVLMPQNGMCRSCLFSILYVHPGTETSAELKLVLDAHFSDLDVCFDVCFNDVTKHGAAVAQSDEEQFLYVQDILNTQKRDAVIWYSTAQRRWYLFIQAHSHESMLLGDESLPPDENTYLETVALSARFHLSPILDEKIQLFEIFSDEPRSINEPSQKRNRHTRQRALIGAQHQPVEKKDEPPQSSAFVASTGYTFASVNESRISHGIAFETGIKLTDSFNILLAASLFGETRFQFTYGDVALKRQRFSLCVERRFAAGRLEFSPLLGLTLERIKMIPTWSDYVMRPGTGPIEDIGGIVGFKGVIWLARPLGIFVQGDLFFTRYKTHFVMMGDESVSLSRVRFGFGVGPIVQF